MEQRKFITIDRPPLEVFKKTGAEIQTSGESAIPGECFDRMEYPESGDMLVHYYDHPYTMKGQPFSEAVDAIQAPKKLIIGTAYFLKKHYILSGIFLGLPLFITGRIIRSLLESFVNKYARAVIQPHILEEKRFCRMAREFRHAGFKVIDTLKKKWKEPAYYILETVSAILQWDNAHRYRAQDLFGSLNKKAFIENPSKEILRLARLRTQRERGWHEDKGKIILVAGVLKLVMFFKPSIKHFLIKFIQEADLKELSLDEADEYYNLLRPDYDIGGMPIELRQRKYVEIMDKYRKEYPGRIQEGAEKRAQMTAFEVLKAHVFSVGGLPLMLFFAIREKDHTNVHLLETEVLKRNSALKQVALKLLQPKKVENEVKT